MAATVLVATLRAGLIVLCHHHRFITTEALWVLTGGQQAPEEPVKIGSVIVCEIHYSFVNVRRVTMLRLPQSLSLVTGGCSWSGWSLFSCSTWRAAPAVRRCRLSGTARRAHVCTREPEDTIYGLNAISLAIEGSHDPFDLKTDMQAYFKRQWDRCRSDNALDKEAQARDIKRANWPIYGSLRSKLLLTEEMYLQCALYETIQQLDYRILGKESALSNIEVKLEELPAHIELQEAKSGSSNSTAKLRSVLESCKLNRTRFQAELAALRSEQQEAQTSCAEYADVMLARSEFAALEAALGLTALREWEGALEKKQSNHKRGKGESFERDAEAVLCSDVVPKLEHGVLGSGVTPQRYG